MRSFQAVLAFLMAAMVNMAAGAPGLHSTMMILATTFVDAVISSGFQHTVATTPGQNEAGKVKPANYEATCFSPSTFPQTGSGNSTLVPWTALADDSDPQSEHAVSHTFKTLCKEISATILTRDIPYTHCQPDSYTNGTYGIVLQMKYLGPQHTYDMRGNYDLCYRNMFWPRLCPYGGLYEKIYFSDASGNHKHSWNLQARAIRGPCPDCAGGLLV